MPEESYLVRLFRHLFSSYKSMSAQMFFAQALA